MVTRPLDRDRTPLAGVAGRDRALRGPYAACLGHTHAGRRGSGYRGASQVVQDRVQP